MAAKIENETKIIQNVLDWKLYHLDLFNIFYNQEATRDLNELLNRVNHNKFCNKILPPLPDEVKCVVDFIVEHIDFSIVHRDMELNHELVQKYSNEVDSCRRKLKSIRPSSYLQSKGFGENLCLELILTHVYTCALLFLDMVLKYLKIMQCPHHLQSHDSLYKELFRCFSALCYLTPISGRAQRRYMTLRGVNVSSAPDIRYCLEHTESPDIELLIVNIGEMKRDEKQNSEGDNHPFSIHREVNSAILGHHGGELILESPFSYYRPNVLGAICIKTEVILTLLELERKHYGQLLHDDACDTPRSYIHYSQPLNFLVAEDRKHLLEPFLRLSLTQRNIDIV